MYDAVLFATLCGLLLGNPEERQDPKVEPFTEFREGLLDLAVRWETLPKDYVPYNRGLPFQECVANCRFYYWEHCPCPPAADLARFPSGATALEMIDAADAYKDYLLERQKVDVVHAKQIEKALEETEHARAAWAEVRSARGDFKDYKVRVDPCYVRKCLRALRDLLGDEAYYRGVMPNPIPLHRVPVEE